MGFQESFWERMASEQRADLKGKKRFAKIQGWRGEQVQWS